MRIGIAGAGRMGRAIADRVDMAPDLELAGIWRRGGDIDEVATGSDVLVDFSLPEALGAVLSAAQRHGRPLVCGVSGLDEQQMAAISKTADSIAIVYDRNMSAGIAVLENAVRLAAAALGPEFEVQVHETHHVHKIDAPSGTALKLGEAVAESLGIDPGGIHYESERRGEVPGDHTVILASATEQLSFHHSVTTREVFADGALRAARWVAARPPGLYSMHDVLA
ncbi:MAG: 4-hydroxy-tetrahydrodipicolinate reductase [Woeseiaceae bacterium]|nr:4-hydroxy-tetrahydrodipicolinate reductase [Woeseiaceae bacterium]